MKYLVIGAGGTGGCIGAFMARAGKDVSIIARGEHLKEIQRNGLTIENPDGNFTVRVNASDMENYNDTPDVIFVCVKGYSLQEAVDFIKKVASEKTIIIPILNIYGTGGKMQEQLPGNLVTDGCIYVASQIKCPGVIAMNGTIFRVVFGVREQKEFREELRAVETDLQDSAIVPILSDNIRRDALQKFSYVSPAAACGLYYDVKADAMQEKGEIRDCFSALIHEIDILANAMNIHFENDIVKTNLDILDKLAPDASTSMQRDIWAGKQSEIDGLIFEVVRMAKRENINLPVYEKIAEEMHKRGF